MKNKIHKNHKNLQANEHLLLNETYLIQPSCLEL
jgi:hypothetical protein